MKRHRQQITANPTVRPWAYRVRAVNPPPTNPTTRATREIAEMLPAIQQRMAATGWEIDPQMTRQSLTQLQRELREATEMVPFVARDSLIQDFRRRLHLFLDH